MDKMRILFLTYQGDIAGSTNSISYLAKGLSERGHEVYLGCRKESLLFSLMEKSKVHLIPMTFKNKFDRQNVKLIRDTVKKYSIQIINAQSSRDRYTSMLAKWFYQLNVVIIHTRRQNPKDMNRLKSLFLQAGADKLVVISEGLKDIFLKAGVSEKFMTVIHNGIPKERYNQWSEERVEYFKNKFNIKPGEVVIGSVSRIKNQDQIVRAVAKLNRPDIKLLFAGIEEKELKDEIQKSKLKNEVIFAGTIPGEEVLNIYRLLDIKILASTMDGFGLALLEAMAMGAPVIATNFGGIKDVISHGKNGLLFKDGDIAQLSSHIQTLLADENLRQQLIKEGYRTALDQFTMEKTIDGYEKLFCNLIKS